MTGATTATTQTDEEIRRAVVAELTWDPSVTPNQIWVAVTRGVVTLTGWVDSFSKRAAAERAALRVRGVRAVVDDIDVRLAAHDMRADVDLAEAARQALEWNTVVPDDAVSVTVSNGWVTLRGEVEREYQRREAERVIRNLTGVTGVTNLIEVRPGTRPVPDDLKKQIEEALVRTAETDAKRIAVDVDGPRVVLAGTVRSWAQRREAERVVWSAPGVTEVDNRIEVRS
jgi:osmotically-inducible protein OsmY